MRTTRDSIAIRGAGVVQVLQPSKGHRFTLDTILLADFCRIRARDRVLEAGAGTGIISLLLARKHSRARFTALEVQRPLHELCRRNIADNDADNLIALLGDLRRPPSSLRASTFDSLVMNPPYTAAGTGQVSADAGRNTARQEVLGSLDLWLDLKRFLKQGGRCFLVFPAARLAELCSLMRDRRLEPKRMRLVHPAADRPASLALIEAVRDGGFGTTVLSPLVVHGPDGGHSREMREIYGN